MVKDPDGNTEEVFRGGCNNLRNFIHVRKTRYLNVSFSFHVSRLRSSSGSVFPHSPAGTTQRNNKERIIFPDSKSSNPDGCSAATGHNCN